MILVNLEVFFFSTGCPAMVKKLSLPYYLLITRVRTVECIPFPRVQAHCKMQTDSFRIRTRVTVSISYNDSQYTMSAFSRDWGIIVI